LVAAVAAVVSDAAVGDLLQVLAVVDCRAAAAAAGLLLLFLVAEKKSWILVLLVTLLFALLLALLLFMVAAVVGSRDDSCLLLEVFIIRRKGLLDCELPLLLLETIPFGLLEDAFAVTCFDAGSAMLFVLAVLVAALSNCNLVRLFLDVSRSDDAFSAAAAVLFVAAAIAAGSLTEC